MADAGGALVFVCCRFALRALGLSDGEKGFGDECTRDTPMLDSVVPDDTGPAGSPPAHAKHDRYHYIPGSGLSVGTVGLANDSLYTARLLSARPV